MTNLHWAAVYTGAHLLLLLILAFGVVSARRKHSVSLGDGDNEAVRQAMRVHANAAEYVPAVLVALVLMALLDGVPNWAIHAVGGGLFLSRALHAFGLGSNPGRSFGRVFGIIGTWLIYLALGAGLIWLGVSPLLG
jgi:uncharacterized membrane protein YecN with MAPEG domain